MSLFTKKSEYNGREYIRPVPVILAITGGLLVLAIVFMIAMPKYNVWRAGLAGEAEMARAEQNRRIAVLEAQAKKDAAKALAEAEIERARGVAEANLIVADSLKGHDEYLRYLWIDKVAENTGREIIYVPTEANLPILEAGRNAAR